MEALPHCLSYTTIELKLCQLQYDTAAQYSAYRHSRVYSCLNSSRGRHFFLDTHFAMDLLTQGYRDSETKRRDAIRDLRNYDDLTLLFYTILTRKVTGYKYLLNYNMYRTVFICSQARGRRSVVGPLIRPPPLPGPAPF